MQVALLQEPFCKSEAEVAALTDWQIVHRYLEPAAERAEQARRDLPTTPDSPATPRRPAATRRESKPDGEPGSPEHRRQMVGAFVNVMGMSPERAAAKYDQQLAAWRASQPGG